MIPFFSLYEIVRNVKANWLNLIYETWTKQIKLNLTDEIEECFYRFLSTVYRINPWFTQKLTRGSCTCLNVTQVRVLELNNFKRHETFLHLKSCANCCNIQSIQFAYCIIRIFLSISISLTFNVFKLIFSAMFIEHCSTLFVADKAPV